MINEPNNLRITSARYLNALSLNRNLIQSNVRVNIAIEKPSMANRPLTRKTTLHRAGNYYLGASN
jgi:hypothetical protein